VFSIDGAPSLVRAASQADPDRRRYALADAATLPFADASFGCVVAYNSLMDMDDMPGTVREAARVLSLNGTLCVCVTHPMVDAGRFESREPDARFIIDRPYLDPQPFDESFERAGLRIRFRGGRSRWRRMHARSKTAGSSSSGCVSPGKPPRRSNRIPPRHAGQRLANFLFIRARKG
jgi:hypothetical protein